MMFNAKKTACMCLGKNKLDMDINLTLNNTRLQWVNNFRYLGVNITDTLDDSNDIFSKRGDLYTSFNTMMSNYGGLHCDIVNSLFRSYCCSFYGAQY